MATARTKTWLPLDRWAEIFGISPLSFNQLFDSDLVDSGECGEVWFQHKYQNTDQVGREDLADAIREAELRLSSVLNYYMLPEWTVDERVKTARPARPEVYASTVGNLRGQAKSIGTRWNRIITGGRRASPLIEADVDVSAGGGALSDFDGDGYDETVTITVNIADDDIGDPSEVRVFYTSTDSGSFAADPAFEVRPVTVTVVGDIATIEFKRWQIVQITLQERLNAESLTATDNASYVTEVDVYRVWNDPQSMADLLWEREGPGGCPACGGAGCPSCDFVTQTGCFHVRDERLGIVAYRPAVWDADDEQFDSAEYVIGRDPEQLLISYYSGYESDNPLIIAPRTQLDPFFEKLIAYYAAAILDTAVCSCNNSERFVDYWREDMARTGQQVAHQISPSSLDNPFGTTRGGLYAWRKIKTGDWIIHR